VNNRHVIKINFKGGIVSPGELYNILVAAGNCNVQHARFGLRQQLLFDVAAEELKIFTGELGSLGCHFEVGNDEYPNIVSSYPAEEIFIANTWLSEGVYKDIFDLVDYKPRLKINISDSNQSFTPMLTGNINWVASPAAQHFWHLFIRFPKTNVIYEWGDMVYTNDIARMSAEIEQKIWANRQKFIGNENACGDELYALIRRDSYIVKRIETKLQLPLFNLPYYEGLNRYHDKSWLGIYRRDELFDRNFLKEICSLCLQTKIGQICSTPWKTIIIKGIEEKDRQQWNHLLEKYQVNVRHAANELNFQIEDNSFDGLKLKNFLVKHLNNGDTRTFGICFGIKTGRKSEVFSSILVRKRALFSIGRVKFFPVYDILCAKDFNPNERTGVIYSRNNLRALLPDQLRKAVFSFYAYKAKLVDLRVKKEVQKETIAKPEKIEYVHQCVHCLSIYDEAAGEPGYGIASHTAFDELPEDYACHLCEAPRNEFVRRKKADLNSQTV
jgi:rubredoxin